MTRLDRREDLTDLVDRIAGLFDRSRIPRAEDCADYKARKARRRALDDLAAEVAGCIEVAVGADLVEVLDGRFAEPRLADAAAYRLWRRIERDARAAGKAVAQGEPVPREFSVAAGLRAWMETAMEECAASLENDIEAEPEFWKAWADDDPRAAVEAAWARYGEEVRGKLRKEMGNSARAESAFARWGLRVTEQLQEKEAFLGGTSARTWVHFWRRAASKSVWEERDRSPGPLEDDENIAGAPRGRDPEDPRNLRAATRDSTLAGLSELARQLEEGRSEQEPGWTEEERLVYELRARRDVDWAWIARIALVRSSPALKDVEREVARQKNLPALIDNPHLRERVAHAVLGHKIRKGAQDGRPSRSAIRKAVNKVCQQHERLQGTRWFWLVYAWCDMHPKQNDPDVVGKKDRALRARWSRKLSPAAILECKERDEAEGQDDDRDLNQHEVLR